MHTQCLYYKLSQFADLSNAGTKVININTRWKQEGKAIIKNHENGKDWAMSNRAWPRQTQKSRKLNEIRVKIKQTDVQYHREWFRNKAS